MVLPELGSNTPDVNVHGARVDIAAHLPHLLEQLVAGEDAARVLDEEREQLERLRLDRYRPTVAQEPVAGQVDLDALVTGRYPLGRTGEALDADLDPTTLKVVVEPAR